MSVIIDQLRISDDGTKMLIDGHVNSSAAYANIYLKTLTITTQDSISESTYAPPSEGYVYQYDFEQGEKEFSMSLIPFNFNEHFSKSTFSDDLFFVFIETVGEPLDTVPCGHDSPYTIGVTFDTALLYQSAMSYTKQLADSCEVSQGFANFILLWSAFKASVETEHWVSAIDFWKMLFEKTPYSSLSYSTGRRCGCHG